MTRITLGGAVLRGAVSTALVASLMSTSALAAPPVDLSKWSPEYVRSIAGTQDFDTAADCAKVTPLDYKGRLTFWYQGVFEGDPDLLRQYYKDFFETFRKTYPNIQLEEQALTYNDLLDKFRTALLGNAAPMVGPPANPGRHRVRRQGLSAAAQARGRRLFDRGFLARRHEGGDLGRRDLRHPDQQRDDGVHLERRHLQAGRASIRTRRRQPGTTSSTIPSRSTTSSAWPATASSPARTPATRRSASCRSSGPMAAACFDEADREPDLQARSSSTAPQSKAALQASYDMYVRDKSVPVSALTNPQAETRRRSSPASSA